MKEKHPYLSENFDTFPMPSNNPPKNDKEVAELFTRVMTQPLSLGSTKTPRGFCGIGIHHPQIESNIGTLFRSAYAFRVDFIFTIGRKYSRQASDTVDSVRHVPYYNYPNYDDFKEHLPFNSRIVCVEITDDAKELKTFIHPPQAVYLLGSEAGGIPNNLLDNSIVVKIPTQVCLNLAVAGSIILWDRMAKGN